MLACSLMARGNPLRAAAHLPSAHIRTLAPKAQLHALARCRHAALAPCRLARSRPLLQPMRRLLSSKSDGKGGGEVAVTEQVYSDIDIARQLPTYGPAATAGWSVVTFGFLGFAACAGLYVAYELLGSNPGEKLQEDSMKRLKENPQIIQMLGSPVKALGEMSKNKARHMTTAETTADDGSKHVQVKFFVKGPKAQGVVWADAVKGSNGLEIERLFVQHAQSGRRVDVVSQFD